MSNTVNFSKFARDVKNPRFRFSVSGRKLTPATSIENYLKLFYIFLSFDQIESVFGHLSHPCKLYGGRPFKAKIAITDDTADQLAASDIGVAITLTNHYFSPENYRECRPFLDRLHSKVNSVIIVNDDLALRIREDFPLFKLKASMIKHISTHKQIEQALQLYDEVVLPMEKNDDDGFLEAVEPKDRVVLFGNATCAYRCPAKNCYRAISKRNLGEKNIPACIRKKQMDPDFKPRSTFFDIKKFSSMGFSKFKLVPAPPAG